MNNNRLWQAMLKVQFSVEQLAEKVGVDEKTAQRWLGGRTPHQRHRWVISQLVKEQPDYLWPEEDRTTAKQQQTNEIVCAYAHRADAPLDLWWELFKNAKKEISLLGFALLFLPEQHPKLTALLMSKAQSGCRIRMLVGDPDGDQVRQRDIEEQLEGTLPSRIRSTIRHFRELQGCANVAIHHHPTPLYNSIFRCDNEMLVTPHLYGVHGSKAPLFHFKRLSAIGVFANFAQHFETVWTTSQPIESERKHE